MGIPFTAEIMNAVVLIAVLSCLTSGLYTASRMLFVLAGRHEAPRRLLEVNGRGVVGFLCVIAAYVSLDTVFLFVYLLICISQYVLRRRTPDDELRVKMWAFPGHSFSGRDDVGVTRPTVCGAVRRASRAARWPRRGRPRP